MAKKNKTSENFKALRYMSVAIITIFILTVVPIVYTVWLSFTNKQMAQRKGDYHMVGFANYVDVFTGAFKDVFFRVFGWTLIFAVVSTLGTFLVGLILALLLNNPNIKERGFYKALLILPWALPVAIAILAWQGLLNGSNGAINNILESIGLARIPWLENAFYARVAVIFVNIWLGFPYMMNICLGALASIPQSYYEAARIDGANAFTQFYKITLPSIAQTAYPLVISSFAFNFNNFGSAYLITEGKPYRKNDSQYAGATDILASVNFKLSSTGDGKYYLAATIAIIIFILLAVITYFQMKASGQFEEVE